MQLKSNYFLPSSQLLFQSKFLSYLNQNCCSGLLTSFLSLNLFSLFSIQQPERSCKMYVKRVIPCLNNFHWLSIALRVKAKILSMAHSDLHDTYPHSVISLIFCSTTLPFIHLQLPWPPQCSTEMPEMYLGPLDLLFPLPEVLFPQISTWLPLSLPSQAYLIITLSARASLSPLHTTASSLFADISYLPCLIFLLALNTVWHAFYFKFFVYFFHQCVIHKSRYFCPFCLRPHPHHLEPCLAIVNASQVFVDDYNAHIHMYIFLTHYKLSLT